jgi:hypothetical protein
MMIFFLIFGGVLGGGLIGIGVGFHYGIVTTAHALHRRAEERGLLREFNKLFALMD